MSKDLTMFELEGRAVEQLHGTATTSGAARTTGEKHS